MNPMSLWSQDSVSGRYRAGSPTDARLSAGRAKYRTRSESPRRRRQYRLDMATSTPASRHRGDCFPTQSTDNPPRRPVRAWQRRIGKALSSAATATSHRSYRAPHQLDSLGAGLRERRQARYESRAAARSATRIAMWTAITDRSSQVSIHVAFVYFAKEKRLDCNQSTFLSAWQKRDSPTALTDRRVRRRRTELLGWSDCTRRSLFVELDQTAPDADALRTPRDLPDGRFAPRANQSFLLGRRSPPGAGADGEWHGSFLLDIPTRRQSCPDETSFVVRFDDLAAALSAP